MNANEIRTYICGASLEEVLAISRACKTRFGELQTQEVTKWKVGTRVYFVHQNQRYEGIVTKVNRKTVSVSCNGMSWKVAGGLLHRVS